MINKDIVTSCYYALSEKNITQKTKCSENFEAPCCYVKYKDIYKNCFDFSLISNFKVSKTSFFGHTAYFADCYPNCNENNTDTYYCDQNDCNYDTSYFSKGIHSTTSPTSPVSSKNKEVW